MDRQLQGTRAVLAVNLYSGSTATDPAPDSAAVTVRRADGTVLASGAATNDGIGKFIFPLTSAQTASLDWLTATWDVTMDGQLSPFKTYHEIVGGHLCRLSELKSLYPTKSDEELATLRTAAERRLEDACHKAFVPRFTVETRTASARYRLAWPNVRAFRWVKINGVAWTGNIAHLGVTPGSVVTGLGGLPYSGMARVTVAYEHGDDYPNPLVRQAVLLAAQETPVGGVDSVDDARIVRREADNQSVTYATPSSREHFLNPTLRALVKDLGTPLVA